MPRKKLKSSTSDKKILGKRTALARETASVVRELPASHPNNHFDLILADFERAVTRLKEVVEQPYSEIIRDSALVRFEFTVELSWKTLRICLKEKFKVKDAESLNSPKGVLREGFKQNLIEDEPFWLEMMDDRNLIVHTYKEEVADQVYAIIPRALGLFQSLLKTLKEKRNE